MAEYLWYIPNTVESGHRGDDVQGGWADLGLSTELAQVVEAHGWGGALLGTGWGRPDTFTVAAALAARTDRYARTSEFVQLVRLLWTRENVTFRGEYYRVEGSTVRPRPFGAERGRHPRLYFGGASAAAEQVAAA